LRRRLHIASHFDPLRHILDDPLEKCTRFLPLVGAVLPLTILLRCKNPTLSKQSAQLAN
jgi:hypothetical protein